MFISGVRNACGRELHYLRAHAWDRALISWVPALTMAIIWAIFSAGVNTKLPIAFVDEDHSQGSRQLAIALEGTGFTAMAAEHTSLADAGTLARERRIYAIVHVPYGWERRAKRG